MQMSLFDGANPFKITKPIRLIELFAGYGSQAFALEYLGVKFEHYRICEWAAKSIQAYKDAHFADDNTDYSASLTADEVVQYLYRKGISADYNHPMTEQQIKRLGESKQRQIYNNLMATHNLVSVCNCKADDLNIVDTDKYDYIMTYSFPCQDLSKAGKGLGMGKDSGTRSGLLWEVERILDECRELPQVLVMENVPDVIGAKNVKHFAKWVAKLDSLGYKSKWGILNAKNYGIPQNRERCFMVSVKGDYFYSFPEPFPLKIRLKDLLEKNVDEKYYLSEKIVRYFMKHTAECKEKGNGFEFKPVDGNCIGRAVTTRAGGRMDDNFIKEPQLEQGAQLEGAYESSNRVYSADGLSPTITTMGGGNREPKIVEPIAYDEQNKYLRQDGCVGTLTTDGSSPKHNNRIVYKCRVRKLTPRECFRLMGVKDADFERIAQNQSDSSLYHCAGDSIVVNVLMELFRGMMNA